MEKRQDLILKLLYRSFVSVVFVRATNDSVFLIARDMQERSQCNYRV